MVAAAAAWKREDLLEGGEGRMVRGVEGGKPPMVAQSVRGGGARGLVHSTVMAATELVSERAAISLKMGEEEVMTREEEADMMAVKVGAAVSLEAVWSSLRGSPGWQFHWLLALVRWGCTLWEGGLYGLPSSTLYLYFIQLTVVQNLHHLQYC